jgi:putative transposase
VQVAPSAYNDRKTCPPSARSLTDAATTEKIARVHWKNDGGYPSTNVHAELGRHGHTVARCTVARVDETAGLRGSCGLNSPRNTVGGPRGSITARTRASVHGQCANQLWVADSTYLRTFTG